MMKLQPGLYRDGWGNVFLISNTFPPRWLAHSGELLAVPGETNASFIQWFINNDGTENLYPLVNGDPIDFSNES